MTAEATDTSFAGEVGASPVPVVLASDPTPARPNWVPEEACTLPTADQPLRLAEFAELFSTAVRAVDRRSPTWLRLRLSHAEGVEARTRDLVDRETGCCDFFDFSVSRAAHEIVLDVRVPAGRAVVLDGLAEQAATAGAQR